MDTVIYGGVRAARDAFSERIKSECGRSLVARFVDALKETRRREASREIAKYARLMASETDALSHVCPITGYPCVGDRSYLCKEYGCARKGGLSPHSDENF